MARMRILAGLLIFGERSIVGMAQRLPLARETWLQVVDVLQGTPELRKLIRRIRYANGQEEVIVDGPNGPARYTIIAASRRARGFAADLVYVDELREIGSDAWEAITPFTTTTGGQIWATSNAGDLTSDALNNLRANILANPSDRVALYEWSAPERAGLDDEDGWVAANPALGHLFPVSVLEDARRTATPGAFRTERLCQFVNALNPAIPMEAVEACQRGDAPAVGEGTLWFAIDASPDSRRADLIVSQMTDDGARFTVLQSWQHEAAVDSVRIADDIARLASEWRPQTILYNHYAAGAVGERLRMLGHIVEDISGVKFAKACDDLLSAMVHGRVTHTGGNELVQHFAQAVAKPAADGGWRLVRRESSGYITIACAAAMAVSKAVDPGTTPMLIVA